MNKLYAILISAGLGSFFGCGAMGKKPVRTIQVRPKTVFETIKEKQAQSKKNVLIESTELPLDLVNLVLEFDPESNAEMTERPNNTSNPFDFEFLRKSELSHEEIQKRMHNLKVELIKTLDTSYAATFKKIQGTNPNMGEAGIFVKMCSDSSIQSFERQLKLAYYTVHTDVELDDQLLTSIVHTVVADYLHTKNPKKDNQVILPIRGFDQVVATDQMIEALQQRCDTIFHDFAFIRSADKYYEEQCDILKKNKPDISSQELREELQKIMVKYLCDKFILVYKNKYQAVNGFPQEIVPLVKDAIDEYLVTKPEMIMQKKLITRKDADIIPQLTQASKTTKSAFCSIM